MTAPSGTPTPTRSGGRGTGVWIGLGLVVLAAIALLALSGRAPVQDPFDADSTAPDGYGALSILLRDRGAEVVSSSAAGAAAAAWGPRDVLLVPAPALSDEDQHDAYEAAAAAGATVVYGEPVVDDQLVVGDEEFGQVPFDWGWIDGRTLADTPAEPAPQDLCDIVSLSGLGPIDAAFAVPVPADGEERSCYGDAGLALIHERTVGTGRVVTLASPYLWANARLQPAKEDGGAPLDNAATALRLLGPSPDGATDGVRVTMVRATPTGGAVVEGSQDPIELLPFPVKLALLQLVAAFGIFVWWRARRLGAPVQERVPVEIAGSELVVAVGDLLRRKGNPTRAAAALRGDARRALGMRLGVPPTAPVSALVAVVATRSGRDEAQVRDALVDAPVADSDALVRLARTLDALRQEVLDVPTPR